MPNRRELLTSISVGGVTLLSGCSYFQGRNRNPLSNELNLEVFWTPTSESNSYRFRLASLTGDTAFITTNNIEGDIELSEDSKNTCSRDSCIYEFQEVEDSVELYTSDTTSGYIEFNVARESNGSSETKTIARFYVEDEQLEYVG